MIDLRRHNIKTREEAIEFLELFEARVPQIKNILKKQNLEIASLKNRLDFVKKTSQQQTFEAKTSVLDSITGKDRVETPSQEQTRIEQLRQAVGDGNIVGSLNVENVDPKPVEDKEPPKIEMKVKEKDNVVSGNTEEVTDPKNQTTAEIVIKKKNGKK